MLEYIEILQHTMQRHRTLLISFQSVTPWRHQWSLKMVKLQIVSKDQHDLLFFKQLTPEVRGNSLHLGCLFKLTYPPEQNQVQAKFAFEGISEVSTQGSCVERAALNLDSFQKQETLHYSLNSMSSLLKQPLSLSVKFLHQQLRYRDQAEQSHIVKSSNFDFDTKSFIKQKKNFLNHVDISRNLHSLAGSQITQSPSSFKLKVRKLLQEVRDTRNQLFFHGEITQKELCATFDPKIHKELDDVVLKKKSKTDISTFPQSSSQLPEDFSNQLRNQCYEKSNKKLILESLEVVDSKNIQSKLKSTRRMEHKQTFSQHYQNADRNIMFRESKSQLSESSSSMRRRYISPYK